MKGEKKFWVLTKKKQVSYSKKILRTMVCGTCSLKAGIMLFRNTDGSYEYYLKNHD